MRKKLLLLTCSILVLGLTMQAQVEPVVLYSFDDTTAAEALDGSGSNNHGEILDTAKWVEGIKGYAVELTDTMSIVVPDLSMTSNVISVALWVNCDTNISTMMTPFWAGDNTTGGGFGAEHEIHLCFEKPDASYWIGGECSFWANGETGDADSSVMLFSDPDKGLVAAATPVNPLIVTDMNWHHIAVVLDGNSNKASLYIDGALIMEKNYWPGAGYDLSHMYLGKMANGGRRYTGKMDEVRIFEDALSETDIADIITADTTKVGVHETAINAFGIIASPNPAAGLTRISFTLKESAHTSATLFNMAGAQIATLYNKEAVKGKNSFNYDVSALPSGVYFIRMESAGQTGFTKLVVK